MKPSLSIGIEEEYQTIDPEPRALRSHIGMEMIEKGRAVLTERVKPEMHQSVIEAGTRVCRNIQEATHEIHMIRRCLIDLAKQNFLAWCIESGKFPDLSRREPPFRPILIVAPLILLDTRTWEMEMANFFANDGVIFWPVLSLHGDQLARIRRHDAEGAEVEIGRPILDLNRIQRNKVVITNYETLKNYQHSFAYMKDGKPLWSFVVSDEAQEFKMPSTKLSHAMKAIEADLHIACTGTPVENRLLDLWNLCDVLQRGLLGSAREFVERFEKTQEEGDQEERLLELKRALLFQQPHAFLLRRTKSEVADLT